MSGTEFGGFSDYYFFQKDPAPKDYRVCGVCVMDTSDPAIVIDENGCNHCKHARVQMEKMRARQMSARDGSDLARTLREERGSSKFDCIIGLSGGVDSSYVAYHLKKVLGLNPLSVHLDNGWNSELAVKNVEGLVNTLGLEYVTHVINWPEFRDLQRSYIAADVVDIEALTDHAITASLFRISKANGGIPIVLGTNSSTESILPTTWIHRKTDARNIRDIHNRFGKVPLRTFPFMSTFRFYANRMLGHPNWYGLLDRIDFKKEEALATLEREVGYRRYPFKHYESIFTRFYQAYILPRKFHFDKRRAHLSALICSGQLTRSQALEDLRKPLYTAERLAEDYSYILKKLGYTHEEFEAYLSRPARSHLEYATDEKLFETMRSLKTFFPRSLVQRLVGTAT